MQKQIDQRNPGYEFPMAYFQNKIACCIAGPCGPICKYLRDTHKHFKGIGKPPTREYKNVHTNFLLQVYFQQSSFYFTHPLFYLLHPMSEVFAVSADTSLPPPLFFNILICSIHCSAGPENTNVGIFCSASELWNGCSADCHRSRGRLQWGQRTVAVAGEKE